MIDVCHRAEDTFNLLRQGVRVVDTEVMDPMLAVLDDLNKMFDAMRAGNDPSPAAPELLAVLDEAREAAARRVSKQGRHRPSRPRHRRARRLTSSWGRSTRASRWYRPRVKTITEEEFESLSR